MQVFRKMFKPALRWMRDARYRETLRLTGKLRYLPHGQATQVKAAGYSINIHDAPSFLNQWEEIFVREAYKFTCNTTQPIIIDCGANMGLGVLYFKSIFPQAQILAYEADAAIAKVLEENVRQNALSNIVVHQQAVWKANEELFFRADGAQGGQVGAGEVRVQGVRLREVLEQYATIHFLKMDIEGAELDVLNDCADALMRVEKIFIEYHSRVEAPQQLDQVLQLLSAQGFRYVLRGCEAYSPFLNPKQESGFDMMIDIFATRQR